METLKAELLSFIENSNTPFKTIEVQGKVTELHAVRRDEFLDFIANVSLSDEAQEALDELGEVFPVVLNIDESGLYPKKELCGWFREPREED